MDSHESNPHRGTMNLVSGVTIIRSGDSNSIASPAKPFKPTKPSPESRPTTASDVTTSANRTVHFSNPVYNESNRVSSDVLHHGKNIVISKHAVHTDSTTKSDTNDADNLASHESASSVITTTKQENVSLPVTLGMTFRRRTSIGTGIIEGILSKVNRDGAKIKHLFTLDNDNLSYVEVPGPSSLSIFSEMLNGKPKRRILSLSTLIVRFDAVIIFFNW